MVRLPKKLSLGELVTALFISALLVLIIAPSAIGDDAELEAIRKALEGIGDPWRAAANPVSELPAWQRRMLLGGLEPDHEEALARYYQLPFELSKTARSAYFDWRNYQGTSWMTPVKNQLGCGSCAAFAT